MIDARNFTYMFYGFAAAFVILVVYVVSLALRERRLRSEIDRVRRMVEDTSKAEDTSKKV
jgi:CcmD family protein